MGKAILAQVFGEQRELIQHTIDMIRACYRVQKTQETSLTSITARIEQIKAKKERLLDLRTDGEITKEEFLSRREKLNTEIQKLEEEQTRIEAETTSFDERIPQWERIEKTLEEILDMSQPKPSPDLIRKFVSKIVPDGATKFHWYLNLDGNGATEQDVTVEGRKNHATVCIGSEEQDAPPDPEDIIELKNAGPITTPHRPRSKTVKQDFRFYKTPCKDSGFHFWDPLFFFTDRCVVFFFMI